MLGGKKRSSKKCVSKSKAQCRSANRKCKFSTKTKRCGSRKSRRKSRKSKKSRKSRKSRKSIRCGARKKSKTCKSAKKTCKWSKKKGCSSRKKKSRKSRRKSRKSCRSKTEKQCRWSKRKCNYNEETKKCRSNPRKKKLPLCPWNAKKDKCLKGKRSEHCEVVLNQKQRRCMRTIVKDKQEELGLDTEEQQLLQALETSVTELECTGDDDCYMDPHKSKCVSNKCVDDDFKYIDTDSWVNDENQQNDDENQQNDDERAEQHQRDPDLVYV
jgi:hypothetical protein